MIKDRIIEVKGMEIVGRICGHVGCEKQIAASIVEFVNEDSRKVGYYAACASSYSEYRKGFSCVTVANAAHDYELTCVCANDAYEVVIIRKDFEITDLA